MDLLDNSRLKSKKKFNSKYDDLLFKQLTRTSMAVGWRTLIKTSKMDPLELKASPMRTTCDVRQGAPDEKSVTSPMVRSMTPAIIRPCLVISLWHAIK